jgi:hypothetical protein
MESLQLLALILVPSQQDETIREKPTYNQVNRAVRHQQNSTTARILLYRWQCPREPDPVPGFSV